MKIDLIKIHICVFTILIWRQMPKDQDKISGLFKTIRIHQLWGIKRIYWLIRLSRKAICDISLMHTNDCLESTSWHTVMQKRFKEESRQYLLPWRHIAIRFLKEALNVRCIFVWNAYGIEMRWCVRMRFFGTRFSVCVFTVPYRSYKIFFLVSPKRWWVWYFISKLEHFLWQRFT